MGKIHFIKNQEERNFEILRSSFNKFQNLCFYILALAVICKRIEVTQNFGVVRPICAYGDKEMICQTRIIFLFEIFCKTSCDAGFACTRVAREDYEWLGEEGMNIAGKQRFNVSKF